MRISRLTCAWFAALLLGACAGGKDAARGVKVEGPQSALDSTGDQPQINSKAKLLFEDAIKALEAQKKSRNFDYPALERKFRAAFEADGNLAEAQYNLGVLAERQGRKEEAVKHYRSALAIKPTLKEAAENLAVIGQNNGDVSGAVEIYQDILKHYPDDASSRARLAEIYRQNGDHDRAIELARQALIREPKTLTAYKVMMRSYLDRRQLSLAKLVALRATKIDEMDPELYHTIGLILLQENEADKALIQLKKAVQVRPDYLPGHLLLTKIALEKEDYGAAEDHLRRILQAHGDSAEAHLNLGVSYKGQGQYDKALQEYQEAEKLKGDLGAIYLNKGIILHRHKDAPEKAIELYKKYLSISGDVAGDAPVFALLREAEQIIQAKEQAKLAEEQAKRAEEENKVRQAEEAKQKEEAAKAAKDAPSGSPAAEGKEEKASDSAKKGQEKKKAAVQPASGQVGKRGPTEPASAPKDGNPSRSEEPSDENLENL